MKRLQTRHTKATPWRTSAVGTWLGVIGAWGGWIVSADTLDGERRRRRTAVRSPMQQREMSPGGRIGATGGSRTYLIVDGCAGEPGAEPSEVVQVVSQEDDNTFSLLACFHQAMPAASKREQARSSAADFPKLWWPAAPLLPCYKAQTFFFLPQPKFSVLTLQLEEKSARCEATST